MNAEGPELRELRQLIARLCDGELDEAGYRRVEELVHGNPAALQLYIDYVLLQGELHWAGGRSSLPAPALFQSEFTEQETGERGAACEQAEGTARRAAHSLNTWQNARSAKASRRRPLVGAAVAAGLLIAAGLWRLGLNGDDAAINPAATAVVAELRSGAGCQWGGKNSKLADGAKLPAGTKLELTAGVARFTFTQGATVLVESPARFSLVSGTALRLEHGNVAVRANGPAKEFTVFSRDASIVDLGTTFAVHCDEQNPTEVDVLEGAVEVVPKKAPQKGRVLEMGANAQISNTGKSVSLIAQREGEYPFTKLVEELWSDIRRDEPDSSAAAAGGDAVVADFTQNKPGNIDTFYAAKRGHGWLTPWVATGNPTGRIQPDDSGFGSQNPYLNVHFERSYERTIAREYGSYAEFNPSEPHVISWRWRLDGDAKVFNGDFQDRATFYGNPFFRRGSWPTNSWLIGVVSGDEVTTGGPGASTEWLKRKYGASTDADGWADGPRRVHGNHWYFFDSKEAGLAGAVFDRRNMIDTGMPIKFNVIYHFAIAVYPQEARYDAAIRDDERTVVRTGLSFRSRDTAPANVVHFAARVNEPTEELAFSLDSVRIQPLKSGTIHQQLEAGNDDKQSKQETQK
jgi:hypothetical protein